MANIQRKMQKSALRGPIITTMRASCTVMATSTTTMVTMFVIVPAGVAFLTLIRIHSCMLDIHGRVSGFENGVRLNSWVYTFHQKRYQFRSPRAYSDNIAHDVLLDGGVDTSYNGVYWDSCGNIVIN